MVLASCCAFSSLSKAANETVKPVDVGLTLGGLVVGALSSGGGLEGMLLDAVELAVSESPSVLSPGNVTGWSRPRGLGRNPSHAKKYQKSFAPAATVDLTSSFSGSTSTTSFAPSSARLPSGVIAGRSASQRVGTAPINRFVPMAITHAESAFGNRAIR